MEQRYNTYSKMLDAVRPKLEALGFRHLSHRWRSEGVHAGFWEDGQSPRHEAPDGDGGGLGWEPCFYSRMDGDSRFVVSGRVEQQFCESFWVFDLKYYLGTRLHIRGELMGPYPVLEVFDILEEDLPKVPGFVQKMRDGGTLLAPQDDGE